MTLSDDERELMDRLDDRLGTMMRSVVKNTQGWDPKAMAPILRHSIRVARYGEAGSRRIVELGSYINSAMNDVTDGHVDKVRELRNQLETAAELEKNLGFGGELHLRLNSAEQKSLLAMIHVYLCVYEATQVSPEVGPGEKP